MDQESLRLFVNRILQKNGHPPVRDFAGEFSDGIKFQLLFNLMYDEKIDCKLKPSIILDDRMLNWNRINSLICFNYLQQRFYLVRETMKGLAKGTNSKFIFKLIKVLLSTQQQDYAEAVRGDTSNIMDITDQIETDRSLYAQSETMAGERDDIGQAIQNIQNEWVD